MLGVGVGVSGARPRGAAVLPAVVDTFTRADSAVSLGSTETGQAWAAISNIWGITTGRAYAANTGVGAAVVNCGAANADLVCTINRAASNSAAIVRSGSNGSGGYRVRCDGTNLLIEDNGGSNTIRATVAQAWSGSHVLTVRCRGTVIEVLYDGVSKLTYNEVVPQTGTYYGLFKNSAQTTGQWFDNFSVTPV